MFLLRQQLLDKLSTTPSSYFGLIVILLFGSLILVSSVSSYWKFRRNIKSRNARLPPGPRILPWLGSIEAIRGINKTPRETCKSLTDYGEMATLWMGSWPVLMINSPRVAHDLMQKASAASSNRPMLNDFRARALPWSLVLAPVGKQFQHLRKIYHSILSEQHATVFKTYDEEESVLLLGRMLEVPQETHFECDRYSFNIMMRALYGVRCGPSQDAVVTETYDMWKEMYWYFIPGSLPFDIFPAILSLPAWLQPWNWTLDRLKKRERQLHVDHLQRVKNLLTSVGPPQQRNFATHLLQSKEVECLDDQALVDICGMLLGAGSDTIGGILQQFLKAIALHPQAAAAAQAEIDAVVGSSRLPTWEDEDKLPYLRALIKEVHRWAPIAVVGIPHATTEDIAYEGYLIPKGTILIPNIPSLMRSPERYANPNAFEPKRFLDDLGDSAESARSSEWNRRDHIHFGWGRRLCPGIYVGEAALYLAISRVLWGFNIQPAAGVPVVMEAENDGLLKKPLPFQLRITSRGAQYEDVIAREIQACSLV